MITGVHGLKGHVKVKSLTAEPADFMAYGDLMDEAGKSYTASIVSSTNEQFIVRIEGIRDRDQAALLKGTSLYADRSLLPPAEEDEFYHADLIGLSVLGLNNLMLGTVAAVHNFGAGDMLEVTGEGKRSEMLPFTKEIVPENDFQNRRLILSIESLF